MFLKGRNIDECINARKNNLDIIRFFAATLVIFSHAYPLTYGNNGSEPFAIFTNGEMTFGELAVSIFFVISGFLITQSFVRSNDPVKYFKARSLRIFPGLIFCVLLSVFILGPIFTELSLMDYFKNRDTYEYMSTITLYLIQYDLPGVFQTNVWPTAVNGSLWTLWYEFFFYIVVAILGVTRLLDRRFVLACFILSSIVYFMGIGGFYSDLFRYFSAGMVFYLYRKQIKLNGWFAILSLVIVILTAKFGFFDYALSIFGTYLIFYIAFDTRLKLENFGKYGDFSYGIYIYAFPFQQIMVYIFHNQLSPLKNFLYSFPVTLLFAIVSWHLVEKRALKYKNVSFKALFSKHSMGGTSKNM
ncbi:acyltransferase [Neobacillus sp. WH10]|uniref:acyltransferase family protein n=1 Tax=Neobacillus sp. WH10 TaxID=3047873 RepID=UPI0024C13450|nr:acyltransferase [Neobacillus sp. WH10]WHY76922.1 acyltransferase [Neobacillus sp. WH10]